MGTKGNCTLLSKVLEHKQTTTWKQQAIRHMVSWKYIYLMPCIFLIQGNNLTLFRLNQLKTIHINMYRLVVLKLSLEHWNSFASKWPYAASISFSLNKKTTSTIISSLHIFECPPLKYKKLNYWRKANYSSKVQLGVKQDRYQQPKHSHSSQGCITEESLCSCKPRKGLKCAGMRK